MQRTTQHVPSIGLRRLHSRRDLNVEYLTRVLQYNLNVRGIIGHASTSRLQGKKRPRDATPPQEKPARKRYKRSVPETEDGEDDTTQEQPAVAILAYRHSLEIQYTRSVGRDNRSFAVGDEEAGPLGWVTEEADLCALVDKVASHQSSEESHAVDLGEMQLALEGRRVNLLHDGTRLMTLPTVDAGFSLQDHDMRNGQVYDPLSACLVLEEAGRAEVTASVRAELLPEYSKNKHRELPVRLIVEMSVALVSPAVFEPFLYSTKTAMSQVEDAQRRALCYIFPSSSKHHAPTSRNIDIPFLYSVIGPAPPVKAPALEVAFQPAALLPALLPFQRRSTAWLLSREHKTLDGDGNVVDRDDATSELPVFWQAVELGDSQIWFLNRLTGRLSPTAPKDASPPGGILAEEPGLGKTLESISLILLNPAIDRNPTHKRWNSETRIFVKDVKTTLIVTPPSLAQQWADELKLHAPSLKVLIYDGYEKLHVPFTEEEMEHVRNEKAQQAKKAKAVIERAGSSSSKTLKSKSKGKGKAADSEDEDEEILDWCNYVNTFDVCITTYNVLQHDLGIARPPPDRPRRTIATYTNIERPRSPLVMVEWYRVIMDEVQMVGGGNTEEMVSLIPRLSSFAVSGTPARSKVDDLIHVLNFLRVEPIVQSSRLWNRLLKPGYSSELIELFARYAIRTMKTAAQEELTIPKQTRYLVPIELGRVERHVYDQNFENALLELGLDARGVAVAENWQVDTGVLRYWLRKLRGICTHPQVGQLQNQDKLHKPGVLKTMGEVLEGMKEQNWRSLMDDRRLKIHTLTIIAQLQQNVKKSNRGNLLSALETLQKAETEAGQVIQDIRTAMSRHRDAGKALKEEAAARRENDEHAENVDDNGEQLHKGKARARDSEEIESLDDADDDDLPHTAAGEEHRIKRRALQQRLRECQITLHRVQFLKGDVHHSLGQTEAENACYAAADDLRRILLKGTERAAKKAMENLAREATRKGVTEKILLIKLPYLNAGGIKSRHLTEEANTMIGDLLNEQGALIWKWRMQLIALLTKPLTVSDDEDADGQEYSRSLDTQGEAEAYLQAYSALLADRREAMTSERTLLAALDVKENKLRKTKAARKAADAVMNRGEALMAIDGIDHQPEHQVLQKELQDTRKAILEDFDSNRSIRSIMIDLSKVVARILRDDDLEKIIAADATRKLKELLKEETKLMDDLQADLTLLRRAFNDRISYFRQLQEISDTVAEAEWEGSADVALAKLESDHTELEVKINTNRARQRYLEHLAKAQGDGDLDEEEEACILCKCDFTRGYITQCAHVFCEACMKAYSSRKDGKTCPLCRTPIIPDQLQRFAVDHNNEQMAPPKIGQNEPAPKSRRQIQYNVINPSTMQTIELMESQGSYGSKIQTLVRHLLYIQIAEPGAKSIVFSAWADSLQIIEHALTQNGIPSLRIDQNKKKESAAKRFKADPSLQVLLLHGERENAGLNITCASRVFLVESVVHHAFEVQAIARIDRMGQTKPTEVYCYYAEETVERNILDLAARQNLSLYTKDNYAGTLTAGPVTVPGKSAIDEPKKRAQKGDFVFKTDDMLAIFFPHLFEELEYLIPDDDAEDAQTATPSSSPIQRRALSNAVAGSSRLSYT
ncbi:SNF2 family N-terminal domain-containing protein [Cytidiella melzeri]|nr:SNF2 family N-terminal domain-containing protein [Cytidiella melzeri]